MTLARKIARKLKSWLLPSYATDVNTRRSKLLAQLSGTGIEIGALHRPVVAEHLNVKYVDRLTVNDLRQQYPELANESLVQPDYLDDAETLVTITDQSQDFVIANHVIEHMVNPIAALMTWQRVLKPGGLLFLAAPDKNYTFDKERELTDIQHILDDFYNPSPARDFQAFEDFAKFVSCRTFAVRPESEYKELAQELWEKQYSIHYHVWDYRHFTKFIEYLEQQWPDWQFKIKDRAATQNQEFIFLLAKA